MTALRRVLLLSVILPSFCGYLIFSGSAASETGGGVADSSPREVVRLREGTVLELQGTFRLAGDRMMFYCEGDGRRFGTLENLNLERIARRVSESAEALQWNVTATVTEFQGANYLLVSRAVVLPNPARRPVSAAPGIPLQLDAQAAESADER